MHNKYILPCFFLSTLAFVSCQITMPREEQTKNIIQEPSLEDSLSTSLESDFFTLGDWPKERWWESFQSPELNGFIAIALAENPSLHEVKAKIAVAKQEAIIVKSNLFPFISFDTEITKTYLSRNGLYRAFNPAIPLNANLIDLSFSLQYEFDFWGKNENLFKAAYGETLAAIAESAQVELLVTTSVANAYFALKANLLRKRLYETLLETSADTLKLQNLMESKALSSKLLPLSLQENLSEIEQPLFIINHEIAISKHLLNSLMGFGPDHPLDIDPDLSPVADTIALPSNLSLNLLARRPDLMAQIWRAKALAYKVGAAIADFYPDINITALAGLESVSYSNLFSAQSKTYTATPALHLPIFTAGAIQANVDAYKASFDEAIFAYNDLVLMSVKEVADLLSLAQSIYKQKYAQNIIVQAAEDRYELTNSRKKAGLDNQFDLYRLHIEVLNKQLTNISLLYEQYAVTIKLIKALGGGYYAPCIPLEGIKSMISSDFPYTLLQAEDCS